jgi:hypothetical protein
MVSKSLATAEPVGGVDDTVQSTSINGSEARTVGARAPLPRIFWRAVAHTPVLWNLAPHYVIVVEK